MRDSTIKTVVAISGIVILEAIALYKGIDGTILTVAVGAISGMAGYTIARAKEE